MDELVVYGVGELGKLFGASALSAGIRVTPITRACDPVQRLHTVPAGTPILVSVAEDALSGALDALPPQALPYTILLQNELWPPVWEERRFLPTVLVPWVLQKPGLPRVVVGTTPCFGVFAELCGLLCARAGMPHERAADGPALHQALAEKYTFILTINALGVWRDELLGDLLASAPTRVRALCDEAARLSAAIVHSAIDVARCHDRTVAAIQAMANVRARGRTARARVDRALALAASYGLETPSLRACVDDGSGRLR